MKYFLEQCLASVLAATREIETEIFVVDNNSADASLEYLQPKFRSVNFIANKTNPGFAKANNQVLSMAKGEFVLFLNPDTILSEESIEAVLQLMKSDHAAGAAGIRMIDGAGHFLPESKRGFPTTWVSFCKMTGLSALFPGSKLFSKYYLGHLAKDLNQEVEALSGAFMMVRKTLLEQTGGFDERYFMYAEDIDLSFEILKAGYKNFYVGGYCIIHFKGESTIKDREYIRRFYGAMVKFIKKHATTGIGRMKTGILRVAIQLRAAFAQPMPSAKTISVPTDFHVIGDTKVGQALASFLSINPQSNNIILCIGDQFGYRQAIDFLQSADKSKKYFFHAKNTGSIVGSDSKNSRGLAIPIKS